MILYVCLFELIIKLTRNEDVGESPFGNRPSNGCGSH